MILTVEKVSLTYNYN